MTLVFSIILEIEKRKDVSMRSLSESGFKVCFHFRVIFIIEFIEFLGVSQFYVESYTAGTR
jgi:hypothetical protein